MTLRARPCDPFETDLGLPPGRRGSPTVDPAAADRFGPFGANVLGQAGHRFHAAFDFAGFSSLALGLFSQ